jgi:cell division septum initiation protein DivIVA
MALRKNKTLLDQASVYIEQVRPQVEAAVATALDAAEEFYENTALPALADAKEKAAPVLAEAKEKASSALNDARDQAAPLVAAGAAKATDLASQAKEAADARVAEAKAEETKKGSKLKKVAIFVAIAGAVGFVAKKLQSRGTSDNWQSSYVPTPAPAPAADDAGAAGPDEALADAAEEPKPVTTPDEPADVVDLEAPVEDAPRKK